MDDAELRRFLDEERKLICATFGPRGMPHLTMLGFVVREGRLWAWSYAKSQKVRNLERDARATIFVESGAEYAEFHGASFECDVQIHRELDAVRAVGAQLAERYDPDAINHAIEAQASKRVALEFIERRRSTYDHRKLPAGVY
jgi:hypothetical protein